jgi:hypothetical protein
VSLQSARSFCRSSHRDERRRRLLTDDLSNSDEWPAGQVEAEDSPSPQKSKHYGDAEFLEHQVRLLDLAPRRWLTIGGLLTLAAAMIAGLEAAYARMVERVAAGATPVAALQIDAKGSLACWFSSLVLLAASVAALLVYSVRRHRTDDYRGRYRVWFWAAAGCFLMATDQAASLREGFRDLMTWLTGTSLSGDGALWWIAVYALVWIAMGTRLVSDMRPSRLSIVALLAATIAQGLALADRMGWLGQILVEAGPREVMFRAGCEMAGNLLLLAAMLLHARYVLMDAEGLLPQRERAAEEPEEAETHVNAREVAKPLVSGGNRWTKIDPPHTAPQPAYRRPATAAAFTSTGVSAPTSASTIAPVSRKLTKAERKALKERLLHERLERQGRG